MKSSKRTLLAVFVFVGVLTSINYFGWWFEDGRLTHPIIMLCLLGMFLYVTTQVFFVWYIYLHAKRLDLPTAIAQREYSVDIFLPTYDEPLELVERSLRAVVAIRYPHTTYVIDDGRNDLVRTIALSYGATYIRRSNTQHYKAGNINNALRQSRGEVVVIFDIDHIPQPDFLDRAIPFFDDPKMGVVQVALDHYNKMENFIASAAGRMSDEFFAATMNGMDQLGCAVVFGSNAIFRRSALVSLGGYKPGLAEDLTTSIHLHADGWRSAYLPAILAKGLVPADLDAFYKQQFKWARGVFDVLFTVLPRLARKLTTRQFVCYSTRMTYYLSGPVIACHVAAALAIPFFATSMKPVEEYILRATPFVASYIAIHMAAYNAFALTSGEVRLNLRGVLLALSSWPVYSLAFISAVFRREPKFVSTPKQSTASPSFKLLLPQLVTVASLLISLMVHVVSSPTFSWEFALLVVFLVLIHLGLILAALPVFGHIGSLLAIDRP